jgi:hypothetical protein
LHDHPTAYESTDIKEYENAITEAAGHVKKNLQYLNFDESVDILILSSDHGLTIKPDLNMYTNKLTTPAEYAQYKKSLFSELKLRSFISIYAKGIIHNIIDSPIIMRDAYNIIREIIPPLASKDYKKIINSITKYRKNEVITSVADLAFGNTAALKFRERFHSHIIYYNGINKWVYTRWPQKEISYFNLENPALSKPAAYIELPLALKKYVSKYYSIEEFLKKRVFQCFIRFIRKIIAAALMLRVVPQITKPKNSL